MSPGQRVLLWLGLLAALAVAALIVSAPVPPPACSDSYDPACATIYEGEG